MYAAWLRLSLDRPGALAARPSRASTTCRTCVRHTVDDHAWGWRCRHGEPPARLPASKKSGIVAGATTPSCGAAPGEHNTSAARRSGWSAGPRLSRTTQAPVLGTGRGGGDSSHAGHYPSVVASGWGSPSARPGRRRLRRCWRGRRSTLRRSRCRRRCGRRRRMRRRSRGSANRTGKGGCAGSSAC